MIQLQNKNGIASATKQSIIYGHSSLAMMSIIIALLLSACTYNEKPEIITVNNDFTMTIPAFMKEDKEVKPGAPFQYANRFRNIYATVFYEEKKEVNKSLTEYYTEQTQIIKNVLLNPAVTDSSTVTVSGATGIRTEIFGKMQGENIYYSHLLLETKTRYYQVCVWTRSEERKLKYDKDIQALLFSFKLLTP